MPLKHYLATYKVIDGVHEHLGHLLIKAPDVRAARSFADTLTHDTSCWDDDDEGCKEHPWSYGDGTTASKVRDVCEISKEQFQFVDEVMASLVYEVRDNRTAANARRKSRRIA